MHYIIIGLLSLLLITIIILSLVIIKKLKSRDNDFIKQKDNESDLKLYLKDEYNELKMTLLKLLNESTEKNKVNLIEFKDSIMNKVDLQLKSINDKVETSLGDGFKSTQETFVKVVERLAKIDEAQKNIEKLSGEVFSLNNILTDKKTRGTFGEIQLHQLIYAVLGDNDKLYQEQKKLSNGKIADVIVHAPKPLGSIVIDSKFPLNSYQKMFEGTVSEHERKISNKQFKEDVKKHIKDIKEKYIIDGQTSDQAIMFIPAEAVFSEIIGNHPDLVEESNKNKVWLVSPTTLISTLTIIQTIVKNMERDKQSKLIVEELKSLAIEFDRYIERWAKLERTAESLTSDIKNVTVTTEKISKKFKSIEEGKLDYIEDVS